MDQEDRLNDLFSNILELIDLSLKDPVKGKKEIIKFFEITKNNKELLVEVINQVDKLFTDVILNSDIYARQAKRYNQKIKIFKQAGFSREEAFELITKPIVLNLNIK